MELVYLWVESHKSISREEFNFSSRFRCHYNDTDNELTIIENKKNINILPSKIKVNAIVGQNGSGKSSLCEILLSTSFEEIHNNINFSLYFDGDKFLVKQGLTGEEYPFKIKNTTPYLYDKVSKPRTIDVIYFSNEVASIFNNPILANRLQNYAQLDAFYESKTNLMPNNKFTGSRDIKDKYEIFNERFHSLLVDDKKIFTSIKDKFIFDFYKRELHFYEIGVHISYNENFMKLLNKDKLRSSVIFEDGMDPKEKFFKLLIIFRLTDDIIENKVEKIIDVIKDEFHVREFDINNCLKIFEQINKYDNKKEVYTRENILDIFERYEYHKNEIWIEKEAVSIDIEYKSINSLLNLLLKKINRTNFFSSKNDDYNYFSLSSGEREYIKIFVTFIYHLKNVGSEFIFLFDEIDLGLHPEWQKSLIKDLIYFANKIIKKNIQIIITTHSPFILSDIPKENVIFLEKGKQVYPFENGQTFGANIHTLLSHGFFMEDGLMGEFAKTKINKIKEYYEEYKDLTVKSSSYEDKRKDYLDKKEGFRYIESVIGEPFIKNIMKNYLDELDILFIGKNEFIDEEIKRLKAMKD